MKTRKTRARNELPTVWEVPDALWEKFFLPLLTEFDPTPRMGRPRADPRRCLSGIIYRARTGCQWNHLPAEFGDDATVHRTLKRWEEKQIFDKLWALLIYHCEDLGAVHWEWQSADGCLNKAKFIGKKGAKAERVPRPHKRKGLARTRVTEAKWASSRASLSRETADHLLRASPEPM
jgi:transposase